MTKHGFTEHKLKVQDSPQALLIDLSRQADTLWDRLARLPTEGVELPHPALHEQLLQPWSRAVARGQHSTLVRRLAWEGIEPERAAAALASTADNRAPAGWTAEVSRYLAAVQGGASAVPATLRERLEPGATPFLELWHPWLEVAAAGLASETIAALDRLGSTARADLDAHLLAGIGWLSAPAAYERFSARRAAAGDGETGLYQGFVRDCLADPIGEFYRHYPVLARQTSERVRQWRSSIGELAQRLVEDREALVAKFAADQDPGAVDAVIASLSDRHRDGREVFLLKFESGLRVVYKPRDLAAEAGLASLFAWCRDRGLGSAPSAARVLRRDGYGWMEFVDQDRPLSAEAAARYFRVAGSLVALSHALLARDLHAENLIATGAGPVIVDAEVLLQPISPKMGTGERALVPSAAGSCLASGLLTQLLPDGREDRDLGGVRKASERTRACRVWRETNTDSMVGELGDEAAAPLANVVFVSDRAHGDRVVGPEDFQAETLAGFESAYEFLLAHRDELLAPDGPLAEFEGAPVRVLFRTSQEYGRVLQLLEQPRNQRSGLTGSWLQEALLSGSAELDERPTYWPLVLDEREALMAGDVPLFTIAADTTVMRTRHGDVVPHSFALSGLDAARQRVDALSRDDMAYQIDLVRRALEPVPEPPAVVRALTATEIVTGDAANATPRPHWPGLCRAAGDDLLDALAADTLSRPDLASGALGPALFLGAFGRAFADDARHAGPLDRLLAPWRAGDLPSATLRELPLGGFSGIGSVIWSLVWLSRVLDAPELLVAADATASLIDPARIESDDAFDLTLGTAGAILGLLALTESTGDKAPLEAARACGVHLLDRQEVASSGGAAWRNRGGLIQTGWAHGAAGIARALAALGSATSESRFAVGASAAIEYERGLLSSEHGNWPFFVTDSAGDRVRKERIVSWCRGAPGIALSRLLLPDAMRDLALSAEIDLALTTTESAPLAPVDHLCCGNLGRAWVLLTAAARDGKPRHRDAAERIANSTLERARRRRILALHSDPYDNRAARPEFLQGIAGIAYLLLRLSGAPDLPDVLALELPSELTARTADAGTRRET